MTFLPSVIRADYRGGFRIRLTFNDQSGATLDFRPWLNGPVFEPLKDPSYFAKFFVEGGTVTWPNGADVAPETLYDAARERFSRRRRHGASAKPRVTRARARGR
ncbi:MAG: DUF2442 domain-containing protein [Acidobacteria bacterium]|nr:MAG: DUF2442 domain-containing protein [Acidobacteriota bacterium]